MADDVMLNQAIEAIRKGQRARARDLLTRLLRADQSNPLYWLWMSSVVETTKEQIYCLQTVLRLDPGNQAARRGLVLIGAMPAGEEVTPVPPVRRQWQAEEIAEPPTGIQALWANPLLRGIAISLATVLVLGMVMAGIFGFRQRAAQLASRPTQRSGPPPTFTLTPTPLGGKPTQKVTPSPTYSGPKPLWMYLEATYTPTPLYVNTPHPISEAFRAGQRAFLRGDMNTALSFLRQASQVDPTAADILYYIGEVQRVQGDYKAALEAYNQAIALNAGFAPAYLGRARARLTLEPRADVSQDLDLAIQYDPNLAEAYLERAAYRLRKGEIEAAMPDLQAAESLLPDSPLVFLYRAQAALASGETQQALSLAQEANRRDITLLPTYLWLGKAYLANQDTQEAIKSLQTFVTYAPDDPLGWLTLAQAYAEIDRPDLAYADLLTTQGGQDLAAALEACNRAIALNQENAELYLYRGLIYLAEGKGQSAVNDLVAARRLEAKSFPINLALGRALLAAGRAREAFAQIEGSQALAQGDEELAAVYYWRAQAAEALNMKPAAIADWRGLLELPPEDVPQAWMMAANDHLATLIPPSVTPSATITATPTKTATFTPSRTPTKTPSPSNTPGATKTPTP